VSFHAVCYRTAVTDLMRFDIFFTVGVCVSLSWFGFRSVLYAELQQDFYGQHVYFWKFRSILNAIVEQ